MNGQQFNEALEKLRQAPRKAEVLQLSTQSTQRTQMQSRCDILEAMNHREFTEALEKVKRRTPCTVKVLWGVLAGKTYADIAQSLGIHPGTVRKHVEKLYQAFGIKGEFEGDRRSRRSELTSLFDQYKHEWVSDCPYAVLTKVSDERKQVNQNSNFPLVLSSTKGEDLMSLATSLLEQLGFNQMFKVTRAFQYTGYRSKHPEKEANPYQLILSQQQEGLCISIPQYILEPYLLILKYWTNGGEIGTVREVIAGKFLVLPTKNDIFLESLHPNYWNLLEVEGKTRGIFYLNEVENIGDDDCDCYLANSSLILQEFSPNALSDSDSYLVLREDKLFSYTWQICISSSEVLQEFINHFGKILIENQGWNVNLDDWNVNLDDIDF